MISFKRSEKQFELIKHGIVKYIAANADPKCEIGDLVEVSNLDRTERLVLPVTYIEPFHGPCSSEFTIISLGESVGVRA